MLTVNILPNLTCNHSQKVASIVSKLDDNLIYTVEILLECTEDDLVEMGLSRPIVRIMLRKAKEISDQSSQHATSAQHGSGLLDAARAPAAKPQPGDDTPVLLISTSLLDADRDL